MIRMFKELLKNSEFQQTIFGIMIAYALLSFIAGLLTPANNFKDDKDCKANSIQEFINIPYRLGCELTKRRW